MSGASRCRGGRTGGRGGEGGPAATTLFGLLSGTVLLVLAGCTPRQPPGPAIELRASDAAAETWCETGEIDLGSASPEPALLGGWGAPSREISDYLWGAGERSALSFRRIDRRSFRIRMRGWAHPRLPEGQAVELAVNGVALPSLWLGVAPGVVDVVVPEGLARPGLNRLDLRYPVVVPTGRYGRPLGPGWDGIRFDSLPGMAASVPAPASSGEIELPVGCGIDFALELPGGSRLQIEGLEEKGGARLEADVVCEGEEPRFGGLESGWRGLRELPLGARERPLPCRLTLRADPRAKAEASAGVRIAAVRLRFVEPPDPAPDLAAARRQLPGSPSFVLYLVDALRADRLGSYGGTPGLTPTLDRFAKEAVRFETARAQSSWTRPAVASLFTGLTPVRHGATDVESRLPAEVQTLAELLKERGYRTGYVTANGNTTAAFGFDQGFDFFRWLHGQNEHQKVRWRAVHAAAREFFDRLPAATPYFLVLHTVETHAPYLPSPRHRARWAAAADPQLGERPTLVGLPERGPAEEVVRQVRALYDAEAADADEGFADLLAELERRGRRADTSIVFLSDHGEELFDHGNVEHGRTLFEEQLRVPMLWSLPGETGSRSVATAIDQIDFVPTLLELAGLPAMPELPGRSFAAALLGGEPPAPRSSPAWLDRHHFHQESISAGGFKLIRDLVPPTVTAVAEETFFAIADDPNERRALDGERALRQNWLRAELRRWRAESGSALDGGAAVVDDRLRRELQALGYIQ